MAPPLKRLATLFVLTSALLALGACGGAFSNADGEGTGGSSGSGGGTGKGKSCEHSGKTYADGAPDGDEARALKLLEKAEQGCLITNSLCGHRELAPQLVRAAS
jgi:hypothetical protein